MYVMVMVTELCDLRSVCIAFGCPMGGHFCCVVVYLQHFFLYVVCRFSEFAICVLSFCMCFLELCAVTLQGHCRHLYRGTKSYVEDAADQDLLCHFLDGTGPYLSKDVPALIPQISRLDRNA